MGENMSEKWVKVRLFTSTWSVWRQNIPIMNYDRELDATIEVEEAEPLEVPKITFVTEPHDSLSNYFCELTAIIPEEMKEEVIKAWKEIREESDPLEITRKLLELVTNYEDNPIVKVYFNNYETKIEIS